MLSKMAPSKLRELMGLRGLFAPGLHGGILGLPHGWRLGVELVGATQIAPLGPATGCRLGVDLGAIRVPARSLSLLLLLHLPLRFLLRVA